jgi:hypothetical protein
MSSLVEIASYLNYGTVGWDFEKDGCRGRQRPMRIIVVVSDNYQIVSILQAVVNIEIMFAVNPLVYKVSTLTCHPFKMGSTNTTLPISVILSGYMLETWIQRRKVGKTNKGIIITQMSLIWTDQLCRLTFFKRVFNHNFSVLHCTIEFLASFPAAFHFRYIFSYSQKFSTFC